MAWLSVLGKILFMIQTFIAVAVFLFGSQYEVFSWAKWVTTM